MALRNAVAVAVLLVVLLTVSPSVSAESSSNTSITITDYLHDAFLNHTLLLRRGEPNNNVQPHFHNLVNTIRILLFRFFSYSNPVVGRVCITPKGLAAFHALATKAETSLQFRRRSMLKNGFNYFFLSDVEYPELPPIAGPREVAYKRAWNFCNRTLQNRLRSFDPNGCMLPNVLDVMYDPHEREQQLWKNTFFISLVSYESFLLCSDFFSETMYYIVRLRILGVEETKCISLLEHALAFIFQFIRANRIDCYSNGNVHLKVPNGHLLQYSNRFDAWTRAASVNRSNAMYIKYNARLKHLSKADVKQWTAKYVNELLTFSARGSRFKYQVTRTGHVIELDYWKLLAGSNAIAHFIGIIEEKEDGDDKHKVEQVRYRPHRRRRNGFLYRWLSMIPRQMIWTSSRSEYTNTLADARADCENPSYWMFIEDLTGPSQCCGEICVQVFEQTRYIHNFNFKYCCSLCHKENNCDPSFIDVFRKVTGVKRRDFGQDYSNVSTIVL